MTALLVFAVVLSFIAAFWSLRAGARARAARADLMTLVRVLEHRASKSSGPGPWPREATGYDVRSLQSDLRATFPEFFTDQERAR